jgi:hypothetical protein
VLTPADIEAVALRVVELLREEGVATRLLTADEVATRLGVDRDYVYAHADELGAKRLGDGPRARLRFDPADLDRRLNPDQGRRGSETAPRPGATPVRRRRRSPVNGQKPPLLPVREPRRTS